jgi:hypothetical protein
MNREWSMRNGIFIGAVVFLLLHPLKCEAQELKEVGHFWAMKGTVQLLPTGEVLKREEGRTTIYSYVEGRYVAVKGTHVPKRVMTWAYFDWQSVDWLDQLDRNDSDIPEDKFWPQNAKVKKLVYLSARNAPVVTVVVCYTVSQPPEGSPLKTSKHIVLAALEGNMTEQGYVYHLLWTKTVQKESSYGELTLQEVPNVGEALVLYSASAGPSSESEQLDIYKLELGAQSKQAGKQGMRTTSSPGKH